MLTNSLTKFSPIAVLAMLGAGLTGCYAGDGQWSEDGFADEGALVAGEEDLMSEEELVLGEASESLVSCSNLDGTNSVMAAMAVAAAQELGRWQPKLDLAIGYTNGTKEISTFSWDQIVKLTATGKARCADGKCAKLQALLDMQFNPASVVKLPGNITLNPSALRSRTVAKFNEQLTCEAQPSNGGTSNCPVEDHKLSFQYSSPGACDTNFYFKATKPDGTALQYPGQLKNKLLWVDRTNPYLAFQNVGELVSIDPTYGLNEGGTSSAGSCTAACTKVSTTSVSGQCCTCNGVNGTFSVSSWNANTYLCK